MLRKRHVLGNAAAAIAIINGQGDLLRALRSGRNDLGCSGAGGRDVTKLQWGATTGVADDRSWASYRRLGVLLLATGQRAYLRRASGEGQRDTTSQELEKSSAAETLDLTTADTRSVLTHRLQR